MTLLLKIQVINVTYQVSTKFSNTANDGFVSNPFSAQLCYSWISLHKTCLIHIVEKHYYMSCDSFNMFCIFQEYHNMNVCYAVPSFLARLSIAYRCTPHDMCTVPAKITIIIEIISDGQSMFKALLYLANYCYDTG